MTTALVVGSGAGGAVVAKELQGLLDVSIVEAGKEFRPFRWPLPRLERLRKTQLLIDEREISFFFPAMQVRKATGGMVLVNGATVGGTTTIATGNGVRMDADLKAIGIDLDREFDELALEIAITTAHQRGWHDATRELFAACHDLRLQPQPTPKMGVHERCAHCGRCVLGCPLGVKWDSRRFVDQAVAQGARLIQGCRVERLVIQHGRAIGVERAPAATAASSPPTSSSSPPVDSVPRPSSSDLASPASRASPSIPCSASPPGNPAAPTAMKSRCPSSSSATATSCPPTSTT